MYGSMGFGHGGPMGPFHGHQSPGVPFIPAPVALAAFLMGLTLGMLIGHKKASMRGMGMPMGMGEGPGAGWMMRKKMMGMMGGHHHHGDGAGACCGEASHEGWPHPQIPED
jgi:hypothetical protein